jgi:hypothetical protein
VRAAATSTAASREANAATRPPIRAPRAHRNGYTGGHCSNSRARRSGWVGVVRATARQTGFSRTRRSRDRPAGASTRAVRGRRRRVRGHEHDGTDRQSGVLPGTHIASVGYIRTAARSTPLFCARRCSWLIMGHRAPWSRVVYSPVVVWVGRLLRALGLTARSQVLPGHPAEPGAGSGRGGSRTIRRSAPSAPQSTYVGDEVASAGVRPAANIISAIMPKGKPACSHSE